MPISRDESERLAKAIEELRFLIEIIAEPEPEPEPIEAEISPQQVRRAKVMLHMEKLLEELHQNVDEVQRKLLQIDFNFQLIKLSEGARQ